MALSRRAAVRKKAAAGSVLFFMIFFLASHTALSAFICGKTYPIAEPDLLKEAHRKAEMIVHNKAYMEKLRKRLRKEALNYRPSYLQYLPPSNRSFSYRYDVVYTLPFSIPRVDIRTGKVVGILYPKGFTFHVMRYIPYFQPLVVFDITNPLEREWVKRKFGDNYSVKLLSVSGDAEDLLRFAREVKRPVFFDIGRLNRRLNIKYTVSIVARDKKNPNLVDVRVVGLKEIKKDLEVRDAEKTVSNKRHKRSEGK